MSLSVDKVSRIAVALVVGALAVCLGASPTFATTPESSAPATSAPETSEPATSEPDGSPDTTAPSQMFSLTVTMTGPLGYWDETAGQWTEVGPERITVAVEAVAADGGRTTVVERVCGDATLCSTVSLPPGTYAVRFVPPGPGSAAITQLDGADVDTFLVDRDLTIDGVWIGTAPPPVPTASTTSTTEAASLSPADELPETGSNVVLAAVAGLLVAGGLVLTRLARQT